jgi:dolichyl-phosphate-mannose--protein O-mannosyl transferase
MLRSLTAWSWFFLAGAVAAFGIGLVLARMYLCGQPGPWAFLVSIAFGAMAALLLFAAAWRAKSWRLAIGGLAAAGFAYVLLFLSSGVTLSGCSGV